MATILQFNVSRHWEVCEDVYALLLRMTSENPMRRNNGNTQLQSPLIFDAWAGTRTAARLGTIRRRGGGCTDKMGSIDLYFVAPLCVHLPQCHLSILQQDFVLAVTETDGDA